MSMGGGVKHSEAWGFSKEGEFASLDSVFIVGPVFCEGMGESVGSTIRAVRLVGNLEFEGDCSILGESTVAKVDVTTRFIGLAGFTARREE